MLNIKRIQQVFEESKYSKREIASICGFTRPTLDGLLRGADVKVSTLCSWAKLFKKPVSYFVEEDVVLEQFNSFGDRGVVARHVGTVDQRSGGGEESVDMAALRAENDKLKSELLEAQRTIINLMGNQK